MSHDMDDEHQKFSIPGCVFYLRSRFLAMRAIPGYMLLSTLSIPSYAYDS